MNNLDKAKTITKALMKKTCLTKQEMEQIIKEQLDKIEVEKK